MADYLSALPMPAPQPQVNPGVAGAPAPAFTPTMTFEDIMRSLNQPISINAPSISSVNPMQGVTLPTLSSAGTGNDALFQRGVSSSTPSAGVDPSIQAVLDRIKASSLDAGRRGMSEAQALAVRRGIGGSSTEQFGVQSALGEAEKSARDAEAQVYIQDAIRRFQLQDLQSRALFDRSNLEYSTGANQNIQQGQLTQQANMANFEAENQRALEAARLGSQTDISNAQIRSNQQLTGAQLGSDELASQRNMMAYLEQLKMETMLGQQGIDLGYANIGAQRDAARDEARYGMISAGIGAFLPSLFGRGGGGGFLGGGTGGASNLVGSANGISPQFGAVGTGVAGPSFMSGGVLPNLGAGLLGYGVGSLINPSGAQTKSGQVGGIAGGIIGSFFGPVGTGIGSAIGTAVGKPVNNALKSIGKSIKKAFPF